MRFKVYPTLFIMLQGFKSLVSFPNILTMSLDYFLHYDNSLFFIKGKQAKMSDTNAILYLLLHLLKRMEAAI